MIADDDAEVTGIWEREEFEEMVARSLIASFESSLVVVPPNEKMAATARLKYPHIVPTHADLQALRKVGPYFPPDDRWILGDEYWHHLDGLPELASLACNGDDRQVVVEGETVTGYLEIYVAIRHRGALPAGCKLFPGNPIALYRLVQFYPQNQGGIWAAGQYFGVTKKGLILHEMYTGSAGKMSAVATLNFFADRRFLWNVRATEHAAHATFGVNAEQIKSLFYARELPLTTMGRKRPILHWVSAHRRRLQRGDDIDIEKHLRGISSFVMNGTEFQITRPLKKGSDNADQT